MLVFAFFLSVPLSLPATAVSQQNGRALPPFLEQTLTGDDTSQNETSRGVHGHGNRQFYLEGSALWNEDTLVNNYQQEQAVSSTHEANATHHTLSGDPYDIKNSALKKPLPAQSGYDGSLNLPNDASQTDLPPGRVGDLRVLEAWRGKDGSVWAQLRFTSEGINSKKATFVELRIGSNAHLLANESDFVTQERIKDVDIAKASFTREEPMKPSQCLNVSVPSQIAAKFAGSAPGTLFFALRLWDKRNRTSPVSNVASATFNDAPREQPLPSDEEATRDITALPHGTHPPLIVPPLLTRIPPERNSAWYTRPTKPKEDAGRTAASAPGKPMLAVTETVKGKRFSGLFTTRGYFGALLILVVVVATSALGRLALYLYAHGRRRKESAGWGTVRHRQRGNSSPTSCGSSVSVTSMTPIAQAQRERASMMIL